MKKVTRDRSKHFYHSLIDIEEIYAHIRKAGFGKKEETKLISLIEETIHIRMIDGVLEKLPVTRHEAFLEQYIQKPNDKKLWEFLKKEIAQIETHLQEVFAKTQKELFEDIKSLKED